ncbi:hypothetical protein ALNOE001_14860 [Candidatus Methanobinarius endosymbioticus]|uniref:Methyltransferase domain-containing protein n=1 Tax=Candidatus Methanobinarius endosymbioticus TaxID=2006182 RepID=A0A366MAD2_9EURY|nr:hypothetical protein ALNOE001_14860 [Candidatus Methanobinarius endosymbioticus]
MERFLKYDRYQHKYQSFAHAEQISFIMRLIAKYNFSNGKRIENVLDIGMDNGVTTLFMLKEGFKNAENFQLYSIEKATEDFFGEDVLKESTPEELKHYHLNRGCTAFDIEKVLKPYTKLDLVFIDGEHISPIL